MASNLGCIGLDTDADGFGALIERAYESSVVVAYRDDLVITRWQDESGARVVFAIDAQGQVLSVTPSLAGEPGANLAELALVGDDLWTASVVDADGEQATACATELEGSAFFDPQNPPSGPASMVALGVGVAFFSDEDAFSASPASLLNDDPGETPAHYVENGWSWPPRLAAESFISYGVFDPANSAHAMLNGTVVAARTAQNSLTGQQFHVARVQTAGFQADLCVPASEHERPTAGQVVSGTVYLVADLNAL